MLQVQTRMVVADNTGAKIAQIIKIPGASKPHYAHIGQIVKVAIKESTPDAKNKKGTMASAVIVRTTKGIMRGNGVKVSFSDNACVLVKADKTPVGTRVFGPVARELKEKGFTKIASLASEVL
ncbi:MAG: 50S ribosomal protein L14 [Mycoplasmataceae bacterium]|jgi:large subunit ribosomal protein L14|nr:50S ribosomal protein L14 [Mycoplasmataceae bacterium]